MTYLQIPFLPILPHVKVFMTIVYTLLNYILNTVLYTVLLTLKIPLFHWRTFDHSNISGGLLLFGTFISVTNVVCTVYSLLYSTVYNLVYFKFLCYCVREFKKGQERKYNLFLKSDQPVPVYSTVWCTVQCTEQCSVHGTGDSSVNYRYVGVSKHSFGCN